MMKILAGCILGISLASTLQAANVMTFGGETVAVFPHQQHQKNLGDCTICHGSKDPGRFIEHKYQWGHAFCQECHRKHKSGPVECNGCHLAS